MLFFLQFWIRKKTSSHRPSVWSCPFLFLHHMLNLFLDVWFLVHTWNIGLEADKQMKFRKAVNAILFKTFKQSKINVLNFEGANGVTNIFQQIEQIKLHKYLVYQVLIIFPTGTSFWINFRAMCMMRLACKSRDISYIWEQSSRKPMPLWTITDFVDIYYILPCIYHVCRMQYLMTCKQLFFLEK